MTDLSRATYIAKARLALLAGVPVPPLTEELGLPPWLVEMANFFTPHLPLFPLNLLTACPSNEIPNRIQWQFHAFLCEDNIATVKTLPLDHPLKTEVLNAIHLVLTLYTTAITTNTPPSPTARRDAWSAAQSATWRSTKSAARSAAWSAATNATCGTAWRSTKRATESAAWSAAWSTAWSTAWNTGWNAAIHRYAEKLLDLLQKENQE